MSSPIAAPSTDSAGPPATRPAVGPLTQLRGLIERALPCSINELLVAAASAVGITFLWWLIVPIIDSASSGGDTRTYMAMAEDPKAVHWAPLAFRGLVPWLAHSIGGQFHYLLAFRLLSWGALAAAALAVYLICRRLGGAHGAGLVAVIGGSSLPMWVFYVHQPYLTDPAAMALLGWSMVAVMSGWLVVLPLLLVLTGLARETVIGYALPLYMWLRRGWVDLATAWQVALVVAPAVIVVWAVRQPMETTGWGSTLELMRQGLVIVNRDIVPRPAFWLFYSFAGSLGIWWVLALHGFRRGGRLWWLLVPVLAQCLFGADYGRFMMFAFPVVLTAGAIALWNHPRRNLLLGLVVIQGLATIVDVVELGILAINDIYTSTIISGCLMALAAVVLWWPARRPTAGAGDEIEAASPQPAAASTR